MFRAWQIFKPSSNLIRGAPLPWKSCHRPMTAVGLRQWSDHNTSGNASQFRIQLKPETLEVVQVSGAVLFQNTDSLVCFDSETWTAAFSVHNRLQQGSFKLWHSDITKLTLPLLSALQGPCEHHDHGKCWNGTSCTPGRFCRELIIHSGCSASPTDQPALSTEINRGNAQRLRDIRWVCKCSSQCLRTCMLPLPHLCPSLGTHAHWLQYHSPITMSVRSLL